MSGIVGKVGTATAAFVAVSAMLGAGPAHAASTDPPVNGTPNTYAVDEDPIAIDSNFTVFSGTMKLFHDGAHVRGALSGSIHATQSDRCIKLAVTFFYADGTHDNTPWDNSPYPCGTSPASLTISSPSGKDVVKYSYYSRATGTTSYTVSYSPTIEGLVGDAPASDGTCTQLDDDVISSSGTNLPSYLGDVRYGCVTSTGNTVATLSGTLDKSGVPSGSSGAVEIAFTYADGSTTTGRISTGTPKLVSDGAGGSYYVYEVGATSDPSKDVRSVMVRTLSKSNSALSVPTYAHPSVSWFGTFVH